jgi:monoamine oxidase
MALTRRQFLNRVGQAGGYGATFTMMRSLGLLAETGPETPPVQRYDVSGKGIKVVILGGGIAGLVTAHEMTKLGYQCTVLEARDRVGGRNWTIRNTSAVRFMDGSQQNCCFSEGNYFNAGPARLPSIHKTMLGYCHELGVPLEVEVNSSRSAMFQADHLNDGAPVEQRQMVNDSRGHVSELLAKCIQKGTLDQELTPEDKERMLTFLRQYGDLSPDYFYKGSDRSGYKVLPGAGPQMPMHKDPLSMHALLNADLWQGMLAEDAIDWQATMFQPIGGMDQIPRAFEKKLNGIIRHNAEVVQIRQTASGVRVVYKDRVTMQTETMICDYCVCAIPLTVLKGVDADFSPEVEAVIQRTTYDSAYKVAWESRRFWEQDHNIYGGISYPQQTVNVVWYPSARMFSPTGVVVSGYGVENGTAFGKLPNTEAKLAASRMAIERLHPGYSKELRNPMYVSWGQIPFNLGSWVSGFGKREQADYARMTQPDRRVYFAGDHTSHLVGWQEGAALSGLRAMQMIGEQVQSGGSRAA